MLQPPSGRSTVPDSDPEMVAMLAWAAERVGLEWRPPPCPEPSRLDDWFLGVARAGSQGPNPVPFFSEVHYELTGTWMAPFPARDRSRVEWSVAMQLCPNTAFTWHGKPLLPSRACRHSLALTGSAYAACGEDASALHALALLQVHQAKALRDLHEGGHDLEVLSELRTATDLTLWATKYTAWSLGRAMSNMVVQEYHLWLCLANMREAGKVQFLECPHVPDWPLRRHGGKLRPAVLHCTKTDFTSVKAVDAPVLRAEIAVLLEKDAIEPVPPADMRSGFYSPYFIVPKKGGGLRPILDLRILNRALHKLLFKMLMQKRIFGCVRPRYWFAAINLKDAFFHVSILPCHRPFLRFAFEGRNISTSPALRAVPIAPCLHESSRGSPCSLERRGHAHSQLPRRLAHTGSGSVMRTQALVLSHLSRLGLRVNWEKSKLSPMQRISFLCIELDSVNQTSVNQSIAQSVLNFLNTFESRTAAPSSTNSFRGSWSIWQLQRQSRRWGCSIWDCFNTGFNMAESRGGRSSTARSGSESLSGTGLQACCGLHGCLRQGLGGHVQQACNVRGLDGSPTALAHQLPRVASSTPGLEPSQEVLTRQARTGRTDNTATNDKKKTFSLTLLSFPQPLTVWLEFPNNA